MRRALIGAVAALAAALVLAPVAGAIDEVNTAKLRKGVTVDGILEHERALQDIAIANDGTRAATTPGYDASVAYVQQRLKRGGIPRSLDAFDFANWEKLGPSTLARVRASPPRPGCEGAATTSCPSSRPRRRDRSVVIDATTSCSTPPGGAGSGDQRLRPGGLGRQDRAARSHWSSAAPARSWTRSNRQAAGAAAVLVFNDGYADRDRAFQIGAPPFIGDPGGDDELRRRRGAVHRRQSGPVNAHFNVVDDHRGGPAVQRDRRLAEGRPVSGRSSSARTSTASSEGPGINDNGSGTATLIEMAEQIAKLDDQAAQPHALRVLGRRGGRPGRLDRVRRRPGANGGIDQIEANLNFDMVASPNFVRFVYDGDNSTGEGDVGPPGLGGDREGVRALLRQAGSGRPSRPRSTGARTTVRSSRTRVVPAGGLFSGAEGIKTAEQGRLYGGVAGLATTRATTRRATRSLNLGNPPFPDADGSSRRRTPSDERQRPDRPGSDRRRGGARAWTLARSQSPIPSPSRPTWPASKVKTASRARKAKANRHDEAPAATRVGSGSAERLPVREVSAYPAGTPSTEVIARNAS